MYNTRYNFPLSYPLDAYDITIVKLLLLNIIPIIKN